MTRYFRLLFVLVFASCTAQLAIAGDLEDGQAAFVRGDYEVAMRIWTPLAEQGNAVLQVALGAMYNNGWGTQKKPEMAAKWFQKAADQGKTTGQFELAYLYSSGRGVKQDYAEANRLYRLSANQSNANAQFNLGVTYAK